MVNVSVIGLVFERLVTSGCAPEWAKEGTRIVAKVPGREDRHPSLSVWEQSGWVNLKDLAGKQSEAEILATLGIGKSELGPPREPGPRSSESAGKVSTRYVYKDESGEPLFQVCRTDPKGFYQQRWEGGRWVTGLEKVRRVPYQLPELAAAALDLTIYVVEGEKDVEALRARGYMATCNPGGAGKFLPEFVDHFSGRPVVIVADKDEAGYRHAAAVRSLLTGVAASIEVVEAKEGKDAFDHLEAGYGVDDFVEVDELNLCGACPDEARKGTGANAARTKGYELRRIGDLLDEPPEEHSWLVEGLFVTGGTSLTVAKPKVGKSTLLRYLAFCVSRGLPFLGRETRHGPVIYLAIEEKKGEVVEQFRKMGCDGTDDLHMHIGSAPVQALEELRAHIEILRPALVIVDPLFKFVRVMDASDYAKVSAALEPVIDLSREVGAHFALSHHRGKGDREDGDAVLGSTAIFAAVDTLLSLRKTADYRTVCSTNRYGEDLEEVVLQYDKVANVLSIGGTVENQRLGKSLGEIADLLRTQPELKEAEIRERIGGNTGLLGKALRGGVDDGRFMRTGAGNKSSPYLYSLSSESSFSSFPYIEKQENDKTNIVKKEV